MERMAEEPEAEIGALLPTKLEDTGDAALLVKTEHDDDEVVAQRDPYELEESGAKDEDIDEVPEKQEERVNKSEVKVEENDDDKSGATDEEEAANSCAFLPHRRRKIVDGADADERTKTTQS